MPMLHTVNKSPFYTSTLESCLDRACAGSAVLLIEDGVYSAVRGTPIEARMVEAMKKLAIYVLGPDLEARGMTHDRIVSGIKVVDYGGFVDLAAQHNNVQSWL
ncbi:MAG: sulfurtransferase complex subunit TusB [Acidiferrobacteraceae bacterium]